MQHAGDIFCCPVEEIFLADRQGFCFGLSLGWGKYQINL
jgi:hypothetical protein